MTAKFNRKKYGELLLDTLPQVIEDDAIYREKLLQCQIRRLST